MIPAAPDGSLRFGGLVLRDHWFDVPLNHRDPTGETISVYARELVAAEQPDADKPWLLFLQGGPGGKAPRPADASAWIGRAVKDFRVLLLDQRGTGRSSPITSRTILRRGDAAAQAEYLSHFGPIPSSAMPNSSGGGSSARERSGACSGSPTAGSAS